MKKRSFFPFLPGILLLCLGLLLGWTCANASPRLLFPSEEALTLPEDFFHSFAAGAPEAAGSMLVGQPRLTFLQPEGPPLSAPSSMLEPWRSLSAHSCSAHPRRGPPRLTGPP